MVGICPAAEDQRHVGPLPGLTSQAAPTLHGFVLQRRDVFEARRGDVPVPARPFLPAPLWRVAGRTAQVGSVSTVTAGPPAPHSPALLVVPGGAAAVAALALTAAAPLLSAAALLSSAGWRCAATPPPSLPLSLWGRRTGITQTN